MDDLIRGLDVEKAEAAMKRAAEKAMHGTREERSGRFFLQGEDRAMTQSKTPPSKFQNENNIET